MQGVGVKKDCKHLARMLLNRKTFKGGIFYPWARHNAAHYASLLLLGIPQEVAKKGTKGTPLGTPPPDGFLRAAGAFSLGKPPPSWAHERTPKMDLLGQKLLLSPPAARAVLS